MSKFSENEFHIEGFESPAEPFSDERLDDLTAFNQPHGGQPLVPEPQSDTTKKFTAPEMASDDPFDDAFFERLANGNIQVTATGTSSDEEAQPKDVRIDPPLRNHRIDRSASLARLLNPTNAEPKRAPSEEETKRIRGPGARNRAVKALRTLVDQNSSYELGIPVRDAKAPSGSLGKADLPPHTPLPRRKARNFINDFYLLNLDFLADRIEQCDGRARCGSLWCSGCQKRFGGSAVHTLQNLIASRYGGDETAIRKNVHHVTILNEIIIPDPEVRTSKEYGRYANFSASEVKRDHVDLLKNLERWQKHHLDQAEKILRQKGLSLEFVTDDNRDRSSPRIENFHADIQALVELNSMIVEAQRLPKKRGRVAQRAEFISRRIPDNDPNRHEKLTRYFDQLRGAKPLTERELFNVAYALQVIYREFKTINRTRFPERLKFKSSVEKVIDRERKKVQGLLDDLPGVSIVGTFELELIDLHHAFRGEYHHPEKVKTLQRLASQSRRRGVRQVAHDIGEEESTPALKARLLDEIRDKVSRGEVPSPEDYPELRYAILLHIHAVVDLNGTPREDFYKWLTGKGGSTRRFKGKWPLERQVKLDCLWTTREIPKSLVTLSFYPYKAALGFNYELSSNLDVDPEFRRESIAFNDEELAILVWLQQSLGFRGTAIRINAGGDFETVVPMPGRKKTQSAMSIFPGFEEFQRKIREALEESGGLDGYLESLGAEERKSFMESQTELDEFFDANDVGTSDDETDDTSSTSDEFRVEGWDE